MAEPVYRRDDIDRDCPNCGAEDCLYYGQDGVILCALCDFEGWPGDDD